MNVALSWNLEAIILSFLYSWAIVLVNPSTEQVSQLDKMNLWILLFLTYSQVHMDGIPLDAFLIVLSLVKKSFPLNLMEREGLRKS